MQYEISVIVTMSVDKFGHHSLGRNGPLSKGPKGDGFHVTSDGDYDMKMKRLKFVNDPKDELDAVNLETLKSSAMLYGPTKITAKNKRIVNLGTPASANDAVTKGYVDSLVPIKNLQSNSYSFHQYNIKDLAYPKHDGDGVNLKYIKENCVLYDKAIDAKGKTITNMDSPLKPSDAITLNYMTANALCKNKSNAFDGQKSVISNVATPVNVDDVVNKRYLKEVLGDLGYTIYKRLNTKRTTSISESDWKAKTLDFSWDDLFSI